MTEHRKKTLGLGLAPLITQAVLNPHIDKETLLQSCDAAKHFGFGGLCTNLNQLPVARERMGSTSKTKLITVIAFPFGAIPLALKVAEAEWAEANGAEELEVVPNYKALMENKLDMFSEELAKICSIGLPVQAILDMNCLQSSNLGNAIEASIDAGVSALQFGNGFGPGVTVENINKLKELIKGRCAIEAVGGINSLDKALTLIEAGANSLGTSYGVEIIQQLQNK